MSAPSEPAEPRGQAASDAPREHREALPVLAREATVLGVRERNLPLPRSSPALVIPMVQAAAAAAGGFVAGAALAGIVRRHQRRTAPKGQRRGARGVRRPQGGARSPARTGELVQVVGTRSLLVDVHLLGER